MLKKERRLNLSFTLENPKAFKTPFFTLLISGNGLSYSRFGFITSKKHDKRATARNRARRLFASYLEKAQVKPGYDMLFILKKEAFEKEKNFIYQAIEEVLHKRNYLL